MAYTSSNLEELLNPLRIQLGDTSATPTYSDEFFHETLRHAINALMTRWSDRYYVGANGVVYRNANVTFPFASPPVIQRKDHRPIVLMASVMFKSGKKFADAGDAVSWKDDEISYSAIESAKQKSSSLKDDMMELEILLPQRKLARPLYGKLHGWSESR